MLDAEFYLPLACVGRADLHPRRMPHDMLATLRDRAASGSAA